MPSQKRKLPPLDPDRRVRARKEEEREPEPESAFESSSSDDAPDQDDSESDIEPSPAAALSSVSFGALARAQASLPPAKQDAKLPLAETTPSASITSKKTQNPKQKRSSKHAPTEQTSKRPVPRYREIIADPRRKPRDPRFDPLVSHGNEAKAKKAYAFLDEYRESEMAELRTRIKNAKGSTADDLKRQLKSLESKRLARRAKEEEEELLREHRKQEKELVAQGKKPFYLKRSERKKTLLTKRYEVMTERQVDKAIEKRRKKIAGKEKKELYSMQRSRVR
ncbi:pre-rRNA processing protein [Ophiocordyceps camponoti-floridani]|uniref:rRNA biogenesis protein RRP36 n=1 Tax=Ophiocordyceps camponoti-floridani TaxID=2030778 RepID=A0A8H4Q4H7_9HYPO|nr:pre-rRNA processing protein [Ophiocordyceps camponoti-floridani]